VIEDVIDAEPTDAGGAEEVLQCSGVEEVNVLGVVVGLAGH
jgi:hypothetical protein